MYIPKNRVFKKILTRPIHQWETKRSYPIREKIFSLPPVAVNPEADTVVTILTTPNTIYDAAWAARSILANLTLTVSLKIVVDGSVFPSVQEKLQIAFPGIELANAEKFLEEAKEKLPNIYRLGSYHPLGRKLAVIFLNQESKHTLFSDADVLCLNSISDLCEAIESATRGKYIQDINGVKTDPILYRKIQSMGLSIAENINTGLLYIPEKSLELSLAEKILDGINDELTSWFGETTILAALMEKAQAIPLPAQKYVVSCQRQFYFEDDVNYNDIAARHFVTPVRHLMYMRGMPKLWNDWQQS